MTLILLKIVFSALVWFSAFMFGVCVWAFPAKSHAWTKLHTQTLFWLMASVLMFFVQFLVTGLAHG